MMRVTSCRKCGRVGKAICESCEAPILAAKARKRELTRRSPRERGYDAQWRRTRALVFARDGDICADCGQFGSTEDNPLTVDHVIPLSRGGTSELSNLRVLCRRCNGWKAAQ
jgi:5-methylcytosine-specific restriction endonuclease McrA